MLTTRSSPAPISTLPVIVPALVTVSAPATPVIVTAPTLLSTCPAATVTLPPETPIVSKRKVPE
ncbi:hypothetical protein NHF48_022265 [Sphingomonas sp. H160509]|uniref:hypothetical protein n=1 Tax=Sphingomonas sp. H160509 TaxID=2955313 RepID=UPI0021E97FB3|nr:hypothetical protein [Sphingomonas sp. H160509]MDD1453026.1 hypothetical protein [Sphingomonas sp. H160509]